MLFLFYLSTFSGEVYTAAYWESNGQKLYHLEGCRFGDRERKINELSISN